MTEFNDYIYPNEYRIALNTAYHPNTTLGTIERGYHFILQNADGSWSSKNGSDHSKIFIDQYYNPSNVVWEKRRIFDDQIYDFVEIEYYNNTVIYFAIAP